jgi:membrane-associated phospholipid phosphatase
LGPDVFAASPASPSPTPSFASLFTGLGQDIRHLATRENALIVGVAGAASLAMLESDAGVTRHASTVPAIDETFDAGAVLGSGMVQGGAALATYIVGRATNDPHLALVGSDLVRAQVITMAFTHGLKLSVGRTRPDGSRYSFPSGHSSAAFATASVLQRHYGWKAGVPAYGLAAYVAASRLSENKHYASDVIFGAALGIVAGRAVTFGHGASTFALTPIAVPKGGGVGLTLVGAR